MDQVAEVNNSDTLATGLMRVGTREKVRVVKYSICSVTCNVPFKVYSFDLVE